MLTFFSSQPRLRRKYTAPPLNASHCPAVETSTCLRHSTPAAVIHIYRNATETYNPFQPFFGAMGCTSAIVFTCFGAAYGTAKAGVGISAMGVLRPDLIVKSQ